MEPVQEKDADDALDIYNGLVSSMTAFREGACESLLLVSAVANPVLRDFSTKVGQCSRESHGKYIIIKDVASSVRSCLYFSMGGTPAFSRRIGRRQLLTEELFG